MQTIETSEKKVNPIILTDGNIDEIDEQEDL
jgi:hypothetical protein